MTQLVPYLPCALILALAACADNSGDYPSLLPTDQLLAEPELLPAGADPVSARSATEARADELRSRADALRGPVIEPSIKQRIEEARR